MFVRGTPLGLQLLEVRAYVFMRRRNQCRRQTIIDGFGNSLHAGVAGAERVEHLALALTPVLQIPGVHVLRIIDRRAVRGEQAPGMERQQTLERREILSEVAAPAQIGRASCRERVCYAV